ncbi:MAG: RnfABCDGE type electron transport complex subunit B [Bacteroidaceae bacterium]
MYSILVSACVLGAIALFSAIVLYFVSRKFAVAEDVRLPQVINALPGANCGGCGYPGCSALAAACIKEADEKGKIEHCNCPVGGRDVMATVGSILGIKVDEVAKQIAVIHCNGTCENRPRIAHCESHTSCAVHHLHFMGDSLCEYGCLGCGDCVKACSFGALKMNKETGIPEVDASKCGACGACATVCPRDIIEIRPVGHKDRYISVACANKQRGAAVVKACKVSCIGCGLCQTACKYSAITIENHLASIDATKCKLCRLCVEACSRNAIIASGFPLRKISNVAEEHKE